MYKSKKNAKFASQFACTINGRVNLNNNRD